MTGDQIVSEVIRLLRSKGRTFGAWSDCQIVSWLSWFMGRNHCGLVFDGGECVGIGLIRYVNSGTEAESPLAHRPDGTVVWVDLVVASCPLVYQILLNQLVLVMKQDGCKAKTLAGRRVRRSERLFMVELSKYLRFNGVEAERV